MKKRGLFTIFAVAILCMALTTPALGANRVTEINLYVTLEQDGSAYVVQPWNGSFDEGIECYFPVQNLGEMTLSGLTVSDEQGDVHHARGLGHRRILRGEGAQMRPESCGGRL